MRVYGTYEPIPDFFPDTPRSAEDQVRDAVKAWENRPSAVLRDIAHVMAAPIAAIALVNLAYFIFH